MKQLTEEEHLSFLGKFHGKEVLCEDKLGIFSDTFSWEGIRPSKDKIYGACRVFCEKSPYLRIYSRNKVFPILRCIEDITEQERDEMMKIKFRFDFSFTDMSWEERCYLESIGIDVPLWFGIGHMNNGETAIDLGIAVEKKEVLHLWQ